MRRSGYSGDVQKCESCFTNQFHSSVLRAWTTKSHWMYDLEVKRIILYLLMVFQSKENLFSALQRDVKYIVIKFVFFSMRVERKRHTFCDVCMPKIHLRSPCETCLLTRTPAPRVSRNYIYQKIDDNLIPVLLECEKCRKPMFVCELHMSSTIGYICFACRNPRKIQDAFDSKPWQSIMKLKLNVDKFGQDKNERRWPLKRT
jgi:hypothetical protein